MSDKKRKTTSKQELDAKLRKLFWDPKVDSKEFFQRSALLTRATRQPGGQNDG